MMVPTVAASCKYTFMLAIKSFVELHSHSMYTLYLF